MKVKIFNGRYGWYIYATNWKDETDKAYLNLRFVKCEEPKALNDASIIIDEGKFECYKGKLELTIFNYRLVEDDTTRFGGEKADSGKSIDIQPNDLPFF